MKNEGKGKLKYIGVVVVLAFLACTYLASATTVITDIQMIIGNVTVGPDKIQVGNTTIGEESINTTDVNASGDLEVAGNITGGSPVKIKGGLTVRDGNVGIGTTSPGEKLTVAGTIESTSGGIKFPDGSVQTAAMTDDIESLNISQWSIFLELEGGIQGAIEGSCEIPGREGTIIVYQLNHGISVPYDPQLGLPTGQRLHRPMKIVKEFDRSSPKLYQALCTGEQLTATLKFYRIDSTGMEEHYFTIKLEDGFIVSVSAFMPSTLEAQNQHYGHMEEVSFTYRRIIWTWEPDGIEYEDNWAAPVA